MQISETTYAVDTAISTYASSQSGESQQAEKAEDVDRFEPSQPVMGAAQSLPGQGPERTGFQVDGSFGFCENCGTSHDASSNSKGQGGTPEVNGVEIPDLHALGESEETESAVATESGGETEGAREEAVERDPMTGEEELTEEEQQEVEELKQRDREVRTHEHAHVAAGGQYIRGGIQYEYQTGPDGKRYAVGGEVSIDTSPESDPEDTIRKAQTIRQAALAPAEPSGQDRRAAAAAAQMEMQARQELMEEKLEGEEGEGGAVGDVDDVLASAVAESGTDNDIGEDREQAGLGDGGQHASDETSVVHEGHAESVAISAEGLDLGEDHDEGLAVAQADGDGLSVDNEDDDEGLPEVSATSAGPPVTQLEYGQNRTSGQLVDVFG